MHDMRYVTKYFPVLAFMIILFIIFSCKTNSNVTIGNIERIDPRINDIVPQGAAIEVLAQGFEWSEGPAWHRTKNHLLFSDIPKNTIYKWSEQEGLSIYMRPSGYTGSDPAGFELGTKGLVFDIHRI